MAELVKQWDNGGSLSVTYEGDGDGSAVFSSDINEGIDREMSVRFNGGGESIERKVTQEGMRQPIALKGGGVFRIANGGRFGVLKGVVEPDEPVKEYEPIEYVTFDGTTIFETGIYGNERISLEMEFQRTNTSGAHYLFGCSSDSRLTGYLSSSGYWRYGTGYPTFNTNNTNKTYAKVTPGNTRVGSYSRSFSYGSFTTAFTIPVGGHKPSSGTPTPQFRGYLWYFKIWIGEELVLDWVPMRRVADGVEGFWDNVTNTFVEKL